MATGSEKLDQIVERLKGTADPKRRYEYVLWLAKKLQPLPEEFRNDAFKVKGCVSQVYVVGQLVLLIEGMEGLEPAAAAAIDPAFLAETGLQTSLTPSRANGFLNILRTMQAQARALADA